MKTDTYGVSATLTFKNEKYEAWLESWDNKAVFTQIEAFKAVVELLKVAAMQSAIVSDIEVFKKEPLGEDVIPARDLPYDTPHGLIKLETCSVRTTKFSK